MIVGRNNCELIELGESVLGEVYGILLLIGRHCGYFYPLVAPTLFAVVGGGYEDGGFLGGAIRFPMVR